MIWVTWVFLFLLIVFSMIVWAVERSELHCKQCGGVLHLVKDRLFVCEDCGETEEK